MIKICKHLATSTLTPVTSLTHAMIFAPNVEPAVMQLCGACSAAVDLLMDDLLIIDVRTEQALKELR